MAATLRERELGDEAPLAPLGATEVQADVASDADQPRPRIRRDFVQSPPGHCERLGRDVVCDLGIAAPGIAADDLEVVLVEPREAALRCIAGMHCLYVSGCGFSISPRTGTSSSQLNHDAVDLKHLGVVTVDVDP